MHYTGLNIQYPISRLIIEGRKTIETRTYPISPKYIGLDLVLIETPGEKGNFKSRGIALIKITRCFKYKDKKEFYLDSERHQVTKDSPWAWKDKPKYGWEIEVIQILNPSVIITKPKGIIYTKGISIEQT